MPRPLFLVGFMAAGKTTVGRQLAAALARPFVDLDEEIAGDAGEPVANLVGTDEAAFRRLEAAALARVIAGTRNAAAGTGPVVATGGGAAAWGDNMDRMRAAGLVIALTAAMGETRARAAGGPSRPLLDRTDDDVLALYHRREPFYRRAHAGVATDDLDPHEVAARALAVVRTHERLPAALAADASYLALGDRTYPVVTDGGGLDGGLVAAHLPPGVTRVALITDSNVAACWGDAALATLRGAGLDVHVATFPAGEASKTLATYGHLCESLVAAGLDRAGAIVGLGGGVVGDLAGFVAATLFRGVPVVHWPTTLVAMTDSAIGGKTGVDLAAGKNLAGAFWQPRLVAAHAPVLATLPLRERRAAFGELWKYALLDGESTWAAVEALAPWAADADADPALATAVVRRAAAYKAWIVGRDEREVTGTRALLNLGHTIGHAIESAAEWRLLHGECVGLGLVAACRVSTALGLGGDALEARVVEALRRTGLDAELDPWLTDGVLARVRADKKRAGARLRFVAVRTVGDCEAVDIAVDELSRILRPRSAL